MTEARLCIVGGGVTKDKAPFNDESAIIWSTASVGLGLPRCDLIFELHDDVFNPEDLNNADCTIFMREKHEDIIKSERFPIERLVERFGKRFNGTVTMMLGWAAIMGFTDIELYGIDFSSDEEYSRRNFFYWMMGNLSAQGYKIKICPGGFMQDTCATYMYEDDGLTYLRNAKERHLGDLSKIDAQLKQLEATKLMLIGAQETIKEIERRY